MRVCLTKKRASLVVLLNVGNESEPGFWKLETYANWNWLHLT